MDGVRWIQTEILEKNPNLSLKIYVVWFNMITGDAPEKWDAQLMPDPRAAHFWDEKRIVGRWYAENLGSGVCDDGIVWDTFYLYGANGTWGTAPLLSTGAPVIRQVEGLRDDLLNLTCG